MTDIAFTIMFTTDIFFTNELAEQQAANNYRASAV